MTRKCNDDLKEIVYALLGFASDINPNFYFTQIEECIVIFRRFYDFLHINTSL